MLASARVIAVLTMCSRLLGLARECVFSYFFSTTELLSAFRIAFMVPNLARRLFGEGALSAAMIPVLTDSIQTRGEEASRRFVGALLARLALLLIALVIVAEIVIALWRLAVDDFALELTAILMPYMALICTVAIAGGVLHVRRRFAVPAAAPIILNLSIIVAALAGGVWRGLTGARLLYVVCGAVLLAGVLQLAATGLALHRASFLPVFGGVRRDPQIRRVLTLMAPMIVGLSAVQINTLADYIITYLFVTGEQGRVGPAVLGYAHFLYQLPLGVFGIALATAIFPVLSQKAAEDDRVGLGAVFGRGIRMSLFMALPASVGLMFVATPLVATLYQRGEFDATATARVAATLVFYSLGLVAYFAQHVVVRTFYAMHDSKTPARVALLMVFLNLAMNLVLVFLLQERGVALATAICATIQVCWLLTKLRTMVPEIEWRPIATVVARMLVATAVMAGALTAVLSSGLARGNLPVRLVALVVAGVLSYALAAYLLRIDELGMALRRGRSLQTLVD
jgi:putative peptidoglycan lipid II flippase